MMFGFMNLNAIPKKEKLERQRQINECKDDSKLINKLQDQIGSSNTPLPIITHIVIILQLTVMSQYQ